MSNRRYFILVVFLLTLAILAIPAQAQGDDPYKPELDPDNFVEGVDHPYFPLVPSTTLIYEGESEGEIERIEVTVTDETKEILGILCVVVRDTVWIDGELVEDTYDWYAQDRDGNVWYMGEDSKEYEDGEVISTEGSWEAGVDGAEPGIIMLAEPQIGEEYRQEYYAGEAEDRAEVISLDDAATVAYGDFENVLVTREWTPLEPGIAEHKYYAEGIGLVLEEKVEGGEGRIELVELLAASDETETEAEDEKGEPSPASKLY